MKNEKKEERRKRKKYRLLVLLLLLFGTGIMLATSTYAWFTSNQTVTVSSIDAQIEAKNGLQISVDGTNWKSIISTADITGADTTYATAKNQLPQILEPVSTNGKVNATGGLDFYYGTVATNDAGNYILTAEKEPDEEHGVDGKYVAFDLFFRVNAPTPVYLMPDSKIISSTETDSGIKNAARVAFITLGTKSIGSTLTEIQGVTNNASSPIKIWEPNYNVHTAAGIANARDTYGLQNITEDHTRLAYGGVKAQITTAENMLLGQATEAQKPDFIENVTIDYSTKFGYTHYVPMMTLSEGITKIRVYMWVEGQDVDCENAASGGSIKFDLKITSLLPEDTPTTEQP